jgi:hypothetical protein
MSFYPFNYPGSIDRPCIIYPQGSGGHWLSNLILHLTNNDQTLPEINIIFDNTTGSKSIHICHGYEQPNGDILLEKKSAEHKHRSLFSSVYKFNLYINVVYKKMLNPIDFSFDINKKSPVDQMMELSDHAVYILKDIRYTDAYCKNIDLEYSLIFTNPELFATTLFAHLDNANIQYTKNLNYVIDSIENYKKTCPNPDDHIGTNSVSWLGWCNAVKILNNLPLNQNISACKTLDEVKVAFDPLQPAILKFSKDYICRW